jgi:hydrogenase-4 component E
MSHWLDAALVIVILTNLMILGSSRLGECIRMTAIQGFTLGFFPLLVHAEGWTWHLFFFAIGAMAVKGGVFPWMLSRAVREAHVRREVEPWVGFTSSIVFGGAALAGAFYLSARMPPSSAPSTLALPTALFMIAVGLFLIVSRKIALSQVLGYLVLENGIYLFGVALVREQPFLVELGVLLDVFVAVFVMGIMIFHIQREFDHIDVDRLDALKDSPS